MSVLIKGMEMPYSCNECDISYYDNTYETLRCPFLFGSMSIYCRERNASCPLVEVPTPHGRLIDMDNIHSMPILSNRGADYLNGEIFVLAKIDELDAVIEAESEE